MVPAELRERLRKHGQEHVLADWDRLNAEQQERFAAELRGIDLAELTHLYAAREQKFELPAADRVTPLPRLRSNDSERQEYRRRAEAAFQAGEVAFLVVAGGQGSR